MAGGNKLVEAKLKGDIIAFPVKAAETIYRGSMVSVDADGFAVQADDTAGELFVGIAEESIAGADVVANGDKFIRVRRRGIFKLTLGTTAPKPSLVGDMVYVSSAQSSSVDETVDLAANTANGVLVGKVVKHGGDSVAMADNSTEVWVDIMGMQDTANASTYLSLTNGASHVAGKGAELIGVEADKGYGAEATVQDALEALVTGQIPIKINDFTEEDGTALTVTADTTVGFKQIANKELVLQITNAEAVALSLGLPDDFNDAASFPVEILVAKNGTDANDAKLTLEVYGPAVGAALGSAANAGPAASALANNTNLQKITFAVDANKIATGCRSLSMVLKATGTDELYILGGCIKYTKDLS